jgi:nucleotide-binding universal stress UspA family protein
MKILIAYDGSIYADAAIDDVRWAGLPANAQAIVLSVVEWPLTAARSWGMVETGADHELAEQVAAAEEVAGTACNRLRTYFPQWDVQLETTIGSAATVVLEKANTWPADLVVVGTHGRSGIKRVVLGSVSLRVVREAACAVRVARPRRHDGSTRLLIGMDGSPEADATVNEVCRRSWPAGTEAQVLAVHEMLVPANAERIAIGERVYDQVNEDEHLRLRHAAQLAAEKLREAGLSVSQVVEEGEPKEVLIRKARDWNVDTLFIGSRGLGRVERLLLGSVSSACVVHAPCTVEVVGERKY